MSAVMAVLNPVMLQRAVQLCCALYTHLGIIAVVARLLYRANAGRCQIRVIVRMYMYQMQTVDTSLPINLNPCFPCHAGKMPAIAALAYHRASGRNISQPNQRLSYSENFLYMLDAANKPGYASAHPTCADVTPRCQEPVLSSASALCPFGYMSQGVGVSVSL